MPKFLRRIIALLLVLCLAVGPSQPGSLSPATVIGKSHAPFDEQALTLAVVCSRRAFHAVFASRFYRLLFRRHPTPTFKDRHAELFAGSRKATPQELVQIIREFGPVDVIASDVDKTLNMQSLTSLGDARLPWNGTVGHLLAANIDQGRR